MENDNQQSSPEKVSYAICPHCKMDIRKIKYMDFGLVRIIYHDVPKACFLAVLNLPAASK